MASGFGKIVVGTYVEIKRSDGKFHPVHSFPAALCKLFGDLCCCGAVEYNKRCPRLRSVTITLTLAARTR